MAASRESCIRVRLFFDYPPPAVIDCRMCWLLVDLNSCRVVADLESIIREKFDFSSRSILSLFIDDCYLPHTESIFVVRDNDSVRVKVNTLAEVNGHRSCTDASSKKSRKRQRPLEEDGLGENGVSVERKGKKKRIKHLEESQEAKVKQASDNEKSKKLNRKKRRKAKENSSTVASKPAPPTKNQQVESIKKPPAAQSKKPSGSSSDSSSSSEEHEAPKEGPALKKPAPKPPLSTSSASKTLPNPKPTQKKSHPTSSSSSETDSSSDDSPGTGGPPKNTHLNKTSSKTKVNFNSENQQAQSVLTSTNCAQKHDAGIATHPDGKAAEPCSSDSAEEIKLVIRKPIQQLGPGVGRGSLWRGCDRGRPGCGGRGGRGRGEGRGVNRGHSGNFDSSCNGAKEPSYQTDLLTNNSVVLQNKADSVPKQDYSSMPLLAAPPQVGQKIAFKLLELAENYTPEISEYKEGRIVSFDPATKQIELELLHVTHQAPVEPGKFDLVYQNPDGSESVEYAVSRGAWVTERWDSLLEPRLVI